MKYERAVEGVISTHDLSGFGVASQKSLHKGARYRANELLRDLAWDDLMLLSMVDWNAALEIRAEEGRKVLERIQKHLDAPPEPMSS